MPYNPLEKEDPDTTLSAEDRKNGRQHYEHKDGKNILTLVKKLA